MQIILDEFNLENQVKPIIYAGFWKRFAAFVIDTMIGLPIMIPAIKYVLLDFKFLNSYVLIAFLCMLLRPFFEYRFGATIGKMVFKLKVVNANFGRANIKEVLLRNVFNLFLGSISLIITFYVCSQPEFSIVNTYTEYTNLYNQYDYSDWEISITFIIGILELIFFFADKRVRALHDRIGETYVIQK